MEIRTLVLGALAALLIYPISSEAHHSYAEWSQDVGTVSGSVTDFQWTNPHAWVKVDVLDGGGTVQHWSFETATPLVLKRFKWKYSSLKPGDKVTVTYHPSRQRGFTGNIMTVLLPDQTVLYTDASEAASATAPGAEPQR